MGRISERHGGVSNNYMGDGCMALFGWDDRDRAAERAVRAAVDIQNAMVSIILAASKKWTFRSAIASAI